MDSPASACRPQDRIGVWSTNCLEWVLLQHAAARAGIILINVNPAYRSHELAYVLRKSRMRAIFLWEKDSRANYRQILEEAAAGEPVPLQHRIFSRPSLLGCDDRRRRGL